LDIDILTDLTGTTLPRRSGCIARDAQALKSTQLPKPTLSVGFFISAAAEKQR
jgi:hypothetical protein